MESLTPPFMWVRYITSQPLVLNKKTQEISLRKSYKNIGQKLQFLYPSYRSHNSPCSNSSRLKPWATIFIQAPLFMVTIAWPSAEWKGVSWIIFVTFTNFHVRGLAVGVMCVNVTIFLFCLFFFNYSYLPNLWYRPAKRDMCGQRPLYVPNTGQIGLSVLDTLHHYINKNSVHFLQSVYDTRDT